MSNINMIQHYLAKDNDQYSSISGSGLIIVMLYWLGLFNVAQPGKFTVLLIILIMPDVIILLFQTKYN